MRGPNSRQGSSLGSHRQEPNMLINVWPFLMTPKSYKPCKDTTKKLHRDVQETLQQFNREHGSSRLYWWSKCHYNELLPTGNTSPAPRFYGLPKIHKANCPMRPIVSACGTATYQLNQIPHQNTAKVHRLLPIHLSKTAKVSVNI